MILIDTGKGLDPLAINALATANEVIVMVTPGRLELDAISRLQEHITLVRNEVLQHANEPVMRDIQLTLADIFHKLLPGLLHHWRLMAGWAYHAVSYRGNG